MSFGLGYIADGFLKGQERNTNFGLRRNQERREETKFGLQVPVLEAEKVKAEEFMSDESKLARANKQTNDGVISNNNATISGYDAIIKGNDASAQNIARTNREREAKALGAESLAEGYGLGNTIKRQQIRSGEEQFTTKAIEFRKKQQEFALQAQAYDQHMQEIFRTGNEAEIKMKAQEALDNRDIEILGLIKSGDEKSALTYLNSLLENKGQNFTRIEMRNGEIAIFNDSGIVKAYDKEKIDGLNYRVKNRAAKAREAKAGTPKVNVEKLFDEQGNQIGERPYITKTDPQTGESYIEYPKERKGTASDVAPVADIQDRIETVEFMYSRNQISKEQYDKFMSDLKQTNAAQPQGEQYPSEDFLYR
jgi:hypothetical protein